MLHTRDGLGLHLVSEVVDVPRLTVAILHGYAEHGGRYGHVQAALAARGISSVVADLRGHGRSAGRRGYVARFEDYHLDVDALLEVARERAEGGPVALLGHSAGGLLAVHWLLRRGSSGLCCAVLSSPFFGLARPLSPVEEWGARFLSYALPWAGLPMKLGGANVCRDPDVQRRYDEDPLVLKRANARWFREAGAAQDQASRRAGELALPLLVLYGGDDRVADPVATERFIVGLRPDVVEARRLDGLFHEILNEPERAEVIASVGDWLLERSASGR